MYISFASAHINHQATSDSETDRDKKQWGFIAHVANCMMKLEQSDLQRIHRVGYTFMRNLKRPFALHPSQSHTHTHTLSYVTYCARANGGNLPCMRPSHTNEKRIYYTHYLNSLCFTTPPSRSRYSHIHSVRRKTAEKIQMQILKLMMQIQIKQTVNFAFCCNDFPMQIVQSNFCFSPPVSAFPHKQTVYGLILIQPCVEGELLHFIQLNGLHRTIAVGVIANNTPLRWMSIVNKIFYKNEMLTSAHFTG